jgi:predicted phosphodiesterase
MRRRALFASLILVLALVSCNIEKTSMVTGAYSSNPFLTPVEVIPEPAGEEVSFLLISDEHIGRTSGGATHNLTNLYAFMDEEEFPFAVSLGDLTDDGRITDAVSSFINNIEDRTGCFLQCVGNHDRHTYGSNYATRLENSHLSMCRYVCGDLSMYVLDNSTRTFTEKQFEWLEEALKADTSKYKIFFAHENLCAGTNLSNTQVMIGFADVAELNKMFSLMEKYKVGLLFTGHSHSGNEVCNSPQGNYAEYNICSFVKTTNFFEPGDRWYKVTVNLTNGKTTVKGYNGTTQQVETNKVFNLPS